MDKEAVRDVLFVTNHIDELIRVAAFMEELGEKWGLSVSLVMSLNLAVEEALTNIIAYGYDDESSHTIEIRLEKSGNELFINVIDDGHEYDPTLKADPDITQSAETRKVGGLGIFLIKKIMDTVEYQRTGNKNYLNLTKNIES